jgi:tyrosinase
MADYTLTRYDVHDLNNGAVAEFPVENPPGWDDVSLYYALALLDMGWQQSADGDTDVNSMWPYSESPDSYFFQAAMHWWPKHPRRIPPAPYNQYWSHCTHGPAAAEPYFLPWHRLYIYFYEILLRAKIATLDGPANWALPYWNYSFYDGTDPSEPWTRSNLPWVFAQPTVPDGRANPLYIADTAKRGFQPLWPGTSETMFLEVSTPYYADAYARSDYNGFNGILDGQPHGAVHVDVGTGDNQVSGTGWMASTVTASFDPVFWMHHSEIDRFWVGWNAQGNQNRSDATWLQAQDDPQRATRWNFWSDGNLGNPSVHYPEAMLDPANLADPFPYSYQYQNLPEVPPPTTTGTGPVRQARGPALEARPPAPSADRRELASADSPVELGKGPTTAEIPLPEEAPRILEGAPHVILRLEDIVADTPGNYEVYLNYPDADQETKGSVPHFVGLLSGFGADHAHEGGEGEHDHQGISASYDITEIVKYLRSQGEWDESKATITFVPAARPRAGLEVVSRMRVGKVRFETV